MAKRPSTVFVCQECGAQAAKWVGKCADCGAWNSYVEERPTDSALGAGAAALGHRYALAGAATARLYADISIEQHARLSTGIDEFDRVLGGGIVPGSLVTSRRRTRHWKVHAAAAGRREHGAHRRSGPL